MSRYLCAALFLILIPAIPGAAQTGPSQDSIRGALLDLAGQTPAPAISREQVTALATFIGNEVSTAPIGTSTGGFTFVFDSRTGVFTRSTTTFGPAFADRSLTTGRGRVSAGFNWLHSSYGSIAGMDVDNGELLTARNAEVPLLPISHGTTYLDVSSDTVVAFATVGVTNNVDVGVILPFVRVSLGAELRIFNADIPVASYAMPQMDASGIGDIGIFGKYRFWQRGSGGMAAQVEIRMPTGDEDNLRGLGITRTQLSAIWSHAGKFAPHATVGYEFWSDDIEITRSLDVSARNQLRYAAGMEIEAHPRLTVLADLIGRRLLKGGKPGYQRFPIELPGGGSFEGLVGLAQGLNVISVAPGVKWNVAGNVLLTGSVLVSVENDGVKAATVPVIGMDWAF